MYRKPSQCNHQWAVLRLIPFPTLRWMHGNNSTSKYFFNPTGTSLSMIWCAYFSALAGISSSHVNATNFAGFNAHLFEQTYDHNSAHTAGSLRRVNILIWWPQLDSGNSQCLIQSCTHSLTWWPPQSLANPWLSAVISDASTTPWPFFTTICKWD